MDAKRICRLAGVEEDRLILLEETESTNDTAKALARQGAPHGTAVLALRQTAGRGRLGRSFLSPAGGIYLSLILRPSFTAQELMPLTALLAACAARAVEEVSNILPQFKWVNDLLLGDKKLAGILTEPAFKGDGTLDFVICGIGLNCNTDPCEFQEEVQAMATSLKAFTGREQDMERLVSALIRHLPQACVREEKAKLLDFYRAHCVTLGKPVRVMGGEVYTATALDVDENAALIVRDEQGELHTVSAGEVSVRGLYGYA